MKAKTIACALCLTALCIPASAGEILDQVTATASIGAGVVRDAGGGVLIQQAQTFTVGKAGRFARA